MRIKTKSGRKVLPNTPEEDAQITAAAITDHDNLPLTDAELGQFKPVREKPQIEAKVQVTLTDT